MREYKHEKDDSRPPTHFCPCERAKGSRVVVGSNMGWHPGLRLLHACTYSRMDVDGREPPAVKRAEAMLKEWRAALTEGTKVDVRCPVSSKWLSSKIVTMVGEAECRVHFDGWGPRHDVVMARDSEDIMPLNMASVPRKRPGTKKKRTPFVVVMYVDGKVSFYLLGEARPHPLR